jgi:hypothetical protein
MPRGRWHEQALDWLRADLVAWRRLPGRALPVDRGDSVGNSGKALIFLFGLPDDARLLESRCRERHLSRVHR